MNLFVVSSPDFWCSGGRFFSVGVWETITSYFLFGLEKESDSCPMATTMASSFSESQLLWSTAAHGREGVCCLGVLTGGKGVGVGGGGLDGVELAPDFELIAATIQAGVLLIRLELWSEEEEEDCGVVKEYAFGACRGERK